MAIHGGYLVDLGGYLVDLGSYLLDHGGYLRDHGGYQYWGRFLEILTHLKI